MSAAEEMVADAVKAERRRIARLLLRWNYVDGRAAAAHIMRQGAKRDRARAGTRGKR